MTRRESKVSDGVRQRDSIEYFRHSCRLLAASLNHLTDNGTGVVAVPPTFRINGWSPVANPDGSVKFTLCSPANPGASPAKPTGALLPPTVIVTWGDARSSVPLGGTSP